MSGIEDFRISQFETHSAAEHNYKYLRPYTDVSVFGPYTSHTLSPELCHVSDGVYKCGTQHSAAGIHQPPIYHISLPSQGWGSRTLALD